MWSPARKALPLIKRHPLVAAALLVTLVAATVAPTLHFAVAHHDDHELGHDCPACLLLNFTFMILATRLVVLWASRNETLDLRPQVTPVLAELRLSPGVRAPPFSI